MNIKEKDPSEIETQAASFLLSEHVPGDLSYMGMANAAKKLIASADDEAKLNEIITESSPYAHDVDAKHVKDAYTRFLREQTELEKNERRQLAPYVANYEKFRGSIALMQKDKDMLLGEGVFSRVYRFPYRDELYAVRIPEGSLDPAMDQIHKHIRACARVADLPHVEKLVAASYTEGVTVSEIAPGKELSKLSLEEFNSITGEQIAELYDTLETAYERNVGFDSHGENLFYDSDAGFTVIDLSVIDSDYQRFDYMRVDTHVKAAIERGFKRATERHHGSRSAQVSRASAELGKKVRQALTPELTDSFSR